MALSPMLNTWVVGICWMRRKTVTSTTALPRISNAWISSPTVQRRQQSQCRAPARRNNSDVQSCSQLQLEWALTQRKAVPLGREAPGIPMRHCSAFVQLCVVIGKDQLWLPLDCGVTWLMDSHSCFSKPLKNSSSQLLLVLSGEPSESQAGFAAKPSQANPQPTLF